MLSRMGDLDANARTLREVDDNEPKKVNVTDLFLHFVCE
jgi:hypothetical protein